MGWGSRPWFRFFWGRSAFGGRGWTYGRRRTASSRPRNGSGIVWLAVLAFALFISWSFIRLDQKFRPTLQAIVRAKTMLVAGQAINEAINDEVFSGVRYENLIRVQMDSKGERILMIQPDTVTINRIADHAVRAIHQKMKDLNGRKLAIPMSEVLGVYTLASFGPSVNLTILPLGMAHVNVKSRFEQAGINQVHHVIVMEIKVVIQAVIPLVTEEVTVTVETPLTDAVVTGDVPANYWNANLGGARLNFTDLNRSSQ